MKKIVTALAIMASSFAFSQVGIGTNTPSSKSILDLTSTDKGFLLPRMSTAQRVAIAPNNTSDKGMQVYDITTNSIWIWSGTAWINLDPAISADGDAWGVTGEDQTTAITRTGNVGIGVGADALAKLNLAHTNMDWGIKNTGTFNGSASFETAIYNDSDVVTNNNFAAVANAIGGASGNGSLLRGMNNYFYNSGGGTIGVSNDFSNSSAGITKGTINFFKNNSATLEMGIDNIFESTSTGNKYGINNEFYNPSNSDCYGISTVLNNAGSGKRMGVNNNIQGTASGELNGVRTYINNSGTGTKYGEFIQITSASGGTHYGIYSDVQKTNSYAGYFIGRTYISNNLGIGTTTPQSSLHLGNAGMFVISNGAYTNNTWNGASQDVTEIGQGWMNSQRSGINANVLLNKPSVASGEQFVNFFSGASSIGTITANSSSSVAYNTTSDIRLKTNIKPTHYSLADVMKIEVKDYNYKTDVTLPQTGFIAQQLNAVFPEAVTVGGEDLTKNPWQVDYSKITPLLVKAIQDQQVQIEELKKEINKLKNNSGKSTK